MDGGTTHCVQPCSTYTVVCRFTAQPVEKSTPHPPLCSNRIGQCFPKVLPFSCLKHLLHDWWAIIIYTHRELLMRLFFLTIWWKWFGFAELASWSNHKYAIAHFKLCMRICMHICVLWFGVWVLRVMARLDFDGWTKVGRWALFTFTHTHIFLQHNDNHYFALPEH